MPLVLFFIVYNKFGLIQATTCLVASSIIVMIIQWLCFRHFSWINLISTIILSISGTITIVSHNVSFIKMKPTILNLLISCLLIYDLIKRKGWVKKFTSKIAELPDDLIRTLTIRWIVFFLFLAVTNEIIWRNFSQDAWVKFKVFGIFGMSIVFYLLHIPIFMKYHKVIAEKFKY